MTNERDYSAKELTERAMGEPAEAYEGMPETGAGQFDEVDPREHLPEDIY
jgi:hypothetical protein